MPLLLLLRNLRWPTKNEVILAQAAGLVFLFALAQRRGEKIAFLANINASKPMVIESIREVKVQGPVVVREKIVHAPGGACTIERVTETAAVTTTRESARQETPAAVASRPRWYLGAGYDAGYAPREAWAARLGISNGRFDAGYRYGRAHQSHGLEVTARF